MLIGTYRSIDSKVVYKAEKFFMQRFLSCNFRMILPAKSTESWGKSLFSRSLKLVFPLEAVIEVVS